MKPSITRLIRRAVELEGGKSQVNIAQARELIRCFATAYYEAWCHITPDVDRTWLEYSINSYVSHRRKSQRKPKRKKK